MDCFGSNLYVRNDSYSFTNSWNSLGILSWDIKAVIDSHRYSLVFVFQYHCNIFFGYKISLYMI